MHGLFFQFSDFKNQNVIDYQRNLRERILEDYKRYKQEVETNFSLLDQNSQVVVPLDFQLLVSNYKSLLLLLSKVKHYNENFSDEEILHMEKELKKHDEARESAINSLFNFLMSILNYRLEH